MANASASSSARRAKPSAAAPTVTRNRLSVCIAILKPSPSVAEQLGADAVELEPGERVRRDHLDPLGDRQAGIVAADDEGGNASRAVLGRAGAREDGQHVGDGAVGDVAFLAGQHAIRRRRCSARMAMLAASEPVSGSVSA